MDRTVSIIDPPMNEYLGNALPSIQAAIDLGANIDDIDSHPKTDGECVVFHYWELTCRANSKGVDRE